MLESMDLNGMIDEIVWLIVVLANQCILIDNLENKTNKPLLTPNELELKMDPYDMTSYREAILKRLPGSSFVVSLNSYDQSVRFG